MKLHRLVILFFSLGPTSVFPQGSLTPPGAPAPLMKSLDQIEPRTDLKTLSGDATAVVVISNPGSYYLSSNLAGAAGKDTIRVTSTATVTIDLNGFALTGTGSGRSAIFTTDAVTIRNGTINATASSSTFAVQGGTRIVCEDLRVLGAGSSLGGSTIQLSDDGTVRRCRVSQGGISTGLRGVVRDTKVDSTATDVSISLGDDSEVTNSQLVTGRGFLSLGERGLVSDCAVNSGGPPTFFVNGSVLQTGGSAVVRNCVVKGGATVGNAVTVGANSVISHCRIASVFRDGISAQVPDVTVESCAVESFGRHGILLGATAQVRDATVNGAGADGITVGDHSIVSHSTVTGITGDGIIAGNGCTIRDSNSSLNDGDGFSTGNFTTLQNCTAHSNQGNGIMAGGSSSVIDCLTSSNGKKTAPTNTASDGIEISGRSRVINCNSFSNAGAGILSNSTNNREFIEGCLLHSNDGLAISLQANGNTVIKNQVGGNTGGTINQTGGNIGPLQNASAAVGTIHPFANFQ